MKTDPDWSDLALFAAVGRAGTLSAAAETTGASAATLSRRLTALEARMGRRLFQHGAQGYALTDDGRALLDRTARMEAAAAEIARWQRDKAGPARIRISAGTWTARHITSNLTRYWTPEADWVPEFVFCNLDLDVARREIDIGIRNRRPDRPWLATRRTGHVDYAAYATGPEVTDWIGASEDAAATRSAVWVRETHAARIVTTANDPRLALSLAEAGVGRVVLPTFAGDAETSLVRVSGTIDALRHEEWLVTHHETRYDPPIRAAIDALAGFLSGSRGA